MIFEQTYIEKFGTQMQTLSRGAVVSNPVTLLSAKIEFLKNEAEILSAILFSVIMNPNVDDWFVLLPI